MVEHVVVLFPGLVIFENFVPVKETFELLNPDRFDLRSLRWCDLHELFLGIGLVFGRSESIRMPFSGKFAIHFADFTLRRVSRQTKNWNQGLAIKSGKLVMAQLLSYHRSNSCRRNTSLASLEHWRKLNKSGWGAELYIWRPFWNWIRSGFLLSKKMCKRHDGDGKSFGFSRSPASASSFHQMTAEEAACVAAFYLFWFFISILALFFVADSRNLSITNALPAFAITQLWSLNSFRNKN